MHKWNINAKSRQGFVLPTVLVVSVIMLSALTMSLSIVWSSRQALKEQFDLQNARNASISGLNVADGCRYGDILISDTITASGSPFGYIDCGKTVATAAINPFILKSSYGGATTSFGFSATFLRDAADVPVAIASNGLIKAGGSVLYNKQSAPSPVPSGCSTVYNPRVVAGSALQTINKCNCPTTRTVAVDARDKNTYWIQKIGDDCWMLTNLAYRGGTSNGGTSTYNDIINPGVGTPGTNTINGPDNSGLATNVLAKYYIPTGANPTIYPTSPSVSSDGGATSPQYGYLYNWCAAMGGQDTAACAEAGTPAVNPTISICPSGWRLPTGKPGDDFTMLNQNINYSSLTSDAGLIGSQGLFMTTGYWNNGFYNIGWKGYYWSSNQVNDAYHAYFLYHHSVHVNPSEGSFSKRNGFSVRCVTE